MKRKRKASKMINQPYTLDKIQDLEAFDLSVINEVLMPLSPQPLPKWSVVWKDIMPEVDELSFMTTFDFPDLGKLKASLKASGSYTEEQLERIIAGLKDLPEYSD
ncbi:MAG: hypothetical protein M1277_01850 [Patescibacteria group bacterium]|nr:hypothetical protein [Patescibacteria group bacterium]